MIQYGHYYRLASPFEENIAAWMFVSPKQDEAIVFLGRILASAQPAFHEVYLMGLDDEALYQEQTSKRIFSGAELMAVGLYFLIFKVISKQSCFISKSYEREGKKYESKYKMVR